MAEVHSLYKGVQPVAPLTMTSPCLTGGAPASAQKFTAETANNKKRTKLITDIAETKREAISAGKSAVKLSKTNKTGSGVEEIRFCRSRIDALTRPLYWECSLRDKDL
eukprot:gb/GEZJ01005622.1/.p2 GENE.gb/GEZJ01005622.1/~~gb/GEZJ01005622.1/.p2  ORF type:complete len:108 (-),score=6.77 gb/GEZJ01005622.1/:10-333(-)